MLGEDEKHLDYRVSVRLEREQEKWHKDMPM
jgi:hypothetical protein